MIDGTDSTVIKSSQRLYRYTHYITQLMNAAADEI